MYGIYFTAALELSKPLKSNKVEETDGSKLTMID